MADGENGVVETVQGLVEEGCSTPPDHVTILFPPVAEAIVMEQNFKS